ncbi:MAG: 5'-methylthioadenosine/S-adenosylhomocysteine nucleosidase [Bryobacteraceae bacterium]|nr:5'-methylthioadenosine/S-adenosylhomocysteine nucleosidase [Bryobacteraceae bacterium]
MKLLVLLLMAGLSLPAAPVVVLISANAEWREVKKRWPAVRMEKTPYGETFALRIAGQPVQFLHGGWGKVAAAGSTQYALTRWRPRVVLNLGTCGGIAGRIDRYAVLLVERTLVYDIVEMMGDSQEAIDHYTTALDLGFLPTPLPGQAKKGLLISADRDLAPEQIPQLVRRYGAVAVDWETAAIAYVARRNGVRLVALRGVSDLVSEAGGEAYGGTGVFESGTARVMHGLLEQLPAWIRAVVR